MRMCIPGLGAQSDVGAQMYDESDTIHLSSCLSKRLVTSSRRIWACPQDELDSMGATRVMMEALSQSQDPLFKAHAQEHGYVYAHEHMHVHVHMHMAPYSRPR